MEELAATATEVFCGYLHIVLSLLLSSLTIPRGLSAGVTATSPDLLVKLLRPLEQTLRCCNSLRGVLRPHIHLVVPAICKVITQLQESVGVESLPWQSKAVVTLRRICTSARGVVVEQSLVVISRMVHCLTRTITVAFDLNVPSNPPQPNPPHFSHNTIYDECITTLCALGCQMGPRFMTFDSLIRRSIDNRPFNSKAYYQLSYDLSNGVILEFGYADTDLSGMILVREYYGVVT